MFRNVRVAWAQDFMLEPQKPVPWQMGGDQVALWLQKLHIGIIYFLRELIGVPIMLPRSSYFFFPNDHETTLLLTVKGFPKTLNAVSRPGRNWKVSTATMSPWMKRWRYATLGQRNPINQKDGWTPINHGMFICLPPFSTGDSDFASIHRYCIMIHVHIHA